MVQVRKYLSFTGMAAAAIVVLLMSFKVNSQPQAQPLDLSQNEGVERLGQDFVLTDKSDALSMAIVRKDRVEFFHFGSIVHGEDHKPDDASMYEIGSVTKLFTSLVLAHAVQEGRIRLQDDFRRYLPGEYPNLSFEGTPVRVVDLADTTSALPDNLPDFKLATAGVPKDQAPFILARTLQQYSEANMLQDLHSVSLLGKPGEMPKHSNLAAELLGFILSRMYKQSFHELVHRDVEEPFGMTSGVAIQPQALVVQGYGPNHVAMPASDQPAMLAAGGLKYSVRDMAKFLQGELAASDPAIQLTQRPAWGLPDTGAVGLNWSISRNVEGALKLNASGGTFGGASYLEIYPQLGYGLVLLANRSGETESLLYGLADDVFGFIEGTPGLHALKTALEQDRYAHVQKTVNTIKKQYPHLHLTEAYVNNWGGGLLDKDPHAALALFQYNVLIWPKSSDAYDSLGDGYARNADTKRAVAAYREALKLNPANSEASQSLNALLQLHK